MGASFDDPQSSSISPRDRGNVASGLAALGTERKTTGVRLARIFGIDVRMHASFLIVFALVVLSLGSGVLPVDWTDATRWIAAIITAVLISASILAHELAHARVALAYQIDVPRITLFVFGGMAEMAREPPSPKIEFLIAGAGPLMSLLIGVVFLSGSTVLMPVDWAATDPEAVLSALSPPALVALKVGAVNIIVAVFNLLPGFPLDGGRLFRALLWWRTGDLRQATQMAAAVGKGIGWVLVGIGAYQALNGDVVGGIWLVLIGLFLTRLASASVSELMLRGALHGLAVGDAMRTRFDRVPPETSVDRFIEDFLVRSDQRVWPLDGYEPASIVSLDQILNLPQGKRQLRVVDVARPIEPDWALSPQGSGREAIQRLATADVDALPVMHDGQVIGLLHRGDVFKWIVLHTPDVR